MRSKIRKFSSKQPQTQPQTQPQNSLHKEFISGIIANVARESPSGKALAFQANIRGFESRLPLLKTDLMVSFFIKFLLILLNDWNKNSIYCLISQR